VTTEEIVAAGEESVSILRATDALIVRISRLNTVAPPLGGLLVEILDHALSTLRDLISKGGN
jgi:hypothetical protein